MPAPGTRMFHHDKQAQRFESRKEMLADSRSYGVFQQRLKRPSWGGVGARGEKMRTGIYRDSRCRLRASSEVFPSMLADFLETDVQENPAWCEELLTGLDQAYSGERFEAYGNLYELEAGPMGVELRKGYDDARAPLRLAIADLKRALAAWRKAIG